MMTRREKLLMRPWQLRRYNNHKKKVINATPVVDFGPPAQRKHVTVKLKKLQKERERQMKIEEDNFKLLQHLGSIMTKKRVDNYWETEPPTFLRRVGIYHRTRTPSPCLISEPTSTPETTLRKSKCLACTPKPERIVLIPEERVPWELPKKILTQRQSKSATCSLLSDFEHRRVKKSHVKSQDLMQSKKSFKEKASNEKKINVLTETKSGLPSIRQTKNLARLEKPEQKIVLRQGSLQIVVNFPSFADVKIIRGKSEKYLQRNFCECRSLRSTN